VDTREHYDVVILGAGLAGLTLTRQLLLNTGKRILLLDKRTEVPGPRQKYGESTVQVAGYYYSRVLDLEEYLWHDQLMKYNLRFYWKTPGRRNDSFEDYSQSYIRQFSNLPCYQLDRNTFEAELLRRNTADARVTFCPGTIGLDVAINTHGPHEVQFTSGGIGRSVRATWVVDTTGRGKFLARRLGLARVNPIRHGSSFMWVEGLVDIDRLTDRSRKEVRMKADRRALGHLPTWLATNHFMGEGFWFWVIPLRHKTSLGVVYDRASVPLQRVNTAEGLLEWVCDEFPLFERDLRSRKVLDFNALKDYSHDCAQTINPARWAMAGEAGRFTDPLYSPGSDLISVYNTLIVDAITTDDGAQLALKCQLYERLMRAFYQGTVPSYAVSYDTLGDQEAFALKYVWELCVYFPFYVFPFINDLFTDRQFLAAYFSTFSRLGPLNARLQQFISDFYQWKKTHLRRPAHPVFNDFTEIAALETAETAFYEVGVSGAEAGPVLQRHLGELRELARFVVAHVASVVLGERGVLTSGAFVESIDVEDIRFDPELFRERYALYAGDDATYRWSFDPFVLDKFRAAAAPAPVGEVAHA
jgi:flavin-dependent dehydrogenase